MNLSKPWNSDSPQDQKPGFYIGEIFPWAQINAPKIYHVDDVSISRFFSGEAMPGLES